MTTPGNDPMPAPAASSPCSRRAGVAGPAALIAALLLPAGLAAQAPDSFVACYVPASGTVYRIAAPGLPADCLAPEHARFSWARLTTAAGDLSGSFPNPTVARLQGRAIAATVPDTGQVLMWTGAAWTPVRPVAGVTRHDALSGLGADDHPQYLLTQGVRQSVNGFAVTGTLSQGVIPATGSGVRLMWYPRRAAFRAGRVSGSEWDDGSIGNHSVAMGDGTLASGAGSFAAGVNSQATAAAAVALGSGSVASGLTSTALGSATRASGTAAVALGQNTTASGVAALAAGRNVLASDSAAIALGSSASAGSGAFVFGDISSAAVVTADRNQFAVRASGGILLRTNAALTTGCTLAAGSGTWACTSSRLAKTDFRDVDAETVLERLGALRIESWRYTDDRSGARHLGPTAQDFRAAFGLGASDTAIATVDADGVNMLAIQALERRTRELRERTEQVEMLTARLVEMERRLGELEARVPR
jgi:hypothetical protein